MSLYNVYRNWQKHTCFNLQLEKEMKLAQSDETQTPQLEAPYTFH